MVDQLSSANNLSTEFRKLSHFDKLGQFDETLYKACKVACIKNEHGKAKYGEDAWFLILEFLNDYINNHSSLEPSQPRQVSQPSQSELHARLKDFIMQRVKYVLQRDDMDLSFRRMTNRLKLDFGQIEVFCKFKLDHILSESKREISCCRT